MKKMCYLFLALIVINKHVFTMGSAERKMPLEVLADDEVAVWQWFAQASRGCNAYERLLPENRAVYEQGIKYQDDPEAVKRSRTNYLDCVLDCIGHAEVPYSKERILNVLMKKTRIMHAPQMEEPKRGSDALSYVFSQILTREEQNAFRRPAFVADRAATERAVGKWADRVAMWHCRLGEIAEHQVENRKAELYRDKMERIEKAYTTSDKKLSYKSRFDVFVDSVGSSGVMHWYNNSWLQQKISYFLNRALRLGEEAPSPKINALGIAAQADVGIPPHKRVAIRKMAKKSWVRNVCGGLTFSDSIYFNEDRLAHVSYGALRCLSLHEAVHAKYHDCAALSLCVLASTLGSSSLASSVISAVTDSTPVNVVGSAVVGLYAAKLLAMRLDGYMERRADIEGSYASRCSECVGEFAKRRRVVFEKEKSALRNNGYLWPDDIETIANDLKAQNKLCSKHS